MNSGEGGLLCTNDSSIMAKAIIYSGAYMLHQRHGTAPAPDVFTDISLDTPNYSGRMDNLRAAILLAQLPELETNCQRWNKRYQAIADTLSKLTGVQLPHRPEQENYVG